MADRLWALLWWPWVDLVSVFAGFAVGYGSLKVALFPGFATTQSFALITGLVLALGYAELVRAEFERIPTHLSGAFL